MSSPGSSHRTLQITLPFGQVVIWSVVAFVLVSIGAEALARSPAVQSALPGPYIDGNPELGRKVLDADHQVAQMGSPDCILVGNSMVEFGLNVESISQGYQSVLGVPITCINLAVPSVNAEGSDRLARIYVKRYHPRLVVYGSTFRDLTTEIATFHYPWLDYNLGQFSVNGWLEADSLAFRYALTYREILTHLRTQISPDTPDALDSSSDDTAQALGDANPGAADSPTAASALVANPMYPMYAAWSKNYVMQPANLAALDDLIALNSSEQQVLLVEMPLAPGVYANLPNGMQTERTYAGEVARRAGMHGVLFLRTLGTVDPPVDNFGDPFHLNSAGGKVFGYWFGQQLAGAVQSGQLRSPSQETSAH